MRTKVHYPTIYTADFDEKSISTATKLLKQPISDIFQELIRLYNYREYKQLTCILHIILETPVDNKSISLIGWFTVNNLVPPPTLYIFISQLVQNINSNEGLKHAIIFARAIYPRLGKFTKFCKSLSSVPNLQFYDLDLYNSLPTFIQHQIVSSHENQYHWINPKLPTEQITKFFISNSFIKFVEESKFQIKDNFLDSIEFSKNLTENDRYSYHIKILLHFGPIKHYKNHELLESACNYVLFLLEEARSIQWESYEYNSQFERLGNWISCLSIQNGAPPRFFLFPIHALIKASINDGTFISIIHLLIGFFTNLSKKNYLQNPYTRSIIERIAPIRLIDGLRTDVIDIIEKFEKLIDVNLSLFIHRKYEIQKDSKIKFTSFIKSSENGTISFQRSLNNEMVINDPDQFYGYFVYFPNLEKQLFPVFKQILTNVKIIEKFYFFGTPKKVKYIDGFDDESFLPCVVSLSLSRDRSISRFFCKLFEKIIRRRTNQIQIDFTTIFRYAFPTKEMLEICFKYHCVTDTEINSLFSELLTNPFTRTISIPRILKLMPVCLKYSEQSQFLSTKILLDCRIHTYQVYSLPMPDSSSVSLLHSFLTFSKNPNDRTDFLNKMDKPSINGIRSLILFVLHSTSKNRSPMNYTTIDYSIIDCLCFAFSKCSGKFNLENLTVKVIESISTTAISVCPKPFFRLFYGFLTFLHFQNNERVIQLLDGLNPGHFPSFSCCWVQIVMHKTVFPQFLKQSSVKVLTFCVKFLQICFQLVEAAPEVFYKPVARILLTTSASQPFFFVSYAPLILEKLPISFVQYRNLILSSSLKQDPDCCPPQGYSSEKIISAVNIADIVNRIVTVSNSDNYFHNYNETGDVSNGSKSEMANFVSSEKVDFVIDVLKNQINDHENVRVKNELKFVPKIVTHFVIYCFSNFIDEVHQFLLKIANAFNVFEFKVFLVAVVDQLRYPNKHSFAAMNFLLSLFEITSVVNKELILIELLRRLFCVSNPPLSVKNTFNQIDLKFGDEIQNILKENGEYDIYLNAKALIGQLLITRSQSGHTIVINK